jgi:hypothetical protein
MSILVSARIIAAELSVSPDLVLTLARRGQIPSVQVGTKIRRFDAAAVRAALQQAGQSEAPANRARENATAAGPA